MGTTGSELLLPGSIVGALVLAAVTPTLRRRWPAATAALLTAFSLGLCAAFAAHLPATVDGGAVRTSIPWAPALAIELSFRLDGLALLFAVAITGVGAAVFAYGGGYFRDDPQGGRVLALLAAFMASMLGVVLADNVIALVLFWEITSVVSFVLIGGDGADHGRRRAAEQALIVTGAGGLALLGGVTLLAQIAGTWELSALTERGEWIRGDARALPALLLVLLAAATKSAQVPFHFWLPGAMVAPTPVSAYLHAATMVKAGVYLLARLQPALGGTVEWTLALTALGGVTALVGGVFALQQPDLKRLLAYATVSALGLLVFLLGVGGEYAGAAFALFVLTHALYKGALFMVAGGIDHAVGTRDLTRLRGLALAMPWTAAAAALAAVSMAGLPPAIGFVAKEGILEAALHAGAPLPAVAVVVAFAVLAALAAALASWWPFGRGDARATEPDADTERDRAPREPARESAALWAPPLALAIAGVAAGIAASPLGDGLIAPAARAVAGHAVAGVPELLPAPGAAPALSLLSLAIAALALARFDTARRWLDAVVSPVRWRGDLVYVALAFRLNLLAYRFTRRWQSGYLRAYLSVTLIATVALVALVSADLAVPAPSLDDVRPAEILLAATMIAAAALAATARTRITAVVALGANGIALAGLWLRFSAPDLAVVQVVIDSLTALLFVLAFLRLPRLNDWSAADARLRHVAIAVAVGVLMGGLTWLAANTHPDRPQSAYYLAASEAAAHGRNVVNTTLIDFRALDTLGEISVLGTAALGVLVLLGTRTSPHAARRQRAAPTAIETGTTRLLAPAIVLFAVYVFLRGHDFPGGGFLGGALAAILVALVAITAGPEAARRLLRVRPGVIVALGLGTAIASGAPSLIRGDAFLAGRWAELELGPAGALAIGTPLIFDAGVFMVVLGVTSLLLLMLMEE